MLYTICNCDAENHSQQIIICPPSSLRPYYELLLSVCLSVPPIRPSLCSFHLVRKSRRESHRNPYLVGMFPVARVTDNTIFVNRKVKGASRAKIRIDGA